MEKRDTTQEGANASTSKEQAANPGKYALLDPYRGMNISDIFKVQLRSAGAVQVFEWSEIGPEPLRSLLRGLGMDPETTRYNVDFIRSDDPLAVGYYQLMGVMPLPSSVKRVKEDREPGETTLAGFIYDYAMSQWRAIGTDLEKVSVKPNGGGKYSAAFHVTQENGVLLIAVSWIDVPENKIVAS